MESTGRRAIDGRMTGPAKVTRRSRLAAPTTAVVLGLLTLLLEAVDVPLEDQIHTLSFGNYGFQLVFIVPFTLVGVVVARREPRNPMGWLLIAVALAGGADHRRLGLHGVRLSLWPPRVAAGSAGGAARLQLRVRAAADAARRPVVSRRAAGHALEVGAARRRSRGYGVFVAGQLSIAAVALGRRVPGVGRRQPDRRPASERLRSVGQRRQSDHPAAVRAALHRGRGAPAGELPHVDRRSPPAAEVAGRRWPRGASSRLLALVSSVANSAPGIVWLFIVLAGPRCRSASASGSCATGSTRSTG